MNNEKTLLKLVRAANTKRFHTVPVIGEQTVGHHTHRMVVILRYIAGGHVSGNLLWHAMFHDLAESETGDVPAVAKWSSSILNGELSRLEEEWNLKHGAHHSLNLEEENLFKLADMLELVVFATEQMLLGNQQMREVRNRGMTYIFERLPNVSHPVKDRVTALIKECVNECQ